MYSNGCKLIQLHVTIKTFQHMPQIHTKSFYSVLLYPNQTHNILSPWNAWLYFLQTKRSKCPPKKSSTWAVHGPFNKIRSMLHSVLLSVEFGNLMTCPDWICWTGFAEVQWWSSFFSEENHGQIRPWGRNLSSTLWDFCLNVTANYLSLLSSQQSYCA